MPVPQPNAHPLEDQHQMDQMDEVDDQNGEDQNDDE